MSVVLLGALVSSAIPVIAVAERTLGARSTLILAVIAVTAAVVVALLWFGIRRRAFGRMVETRKKDDTHPEMAHDSALPEYGSVKYLVVALVTARLYAA